MLRFKMQRSVIAPLLLGGMMLAGPFSMPETWDGLWSRVAAWLGGSSGWALSMSDSSSGIDPNGRPEGASTGSTDSEYSSGIDPDSRQ
jgi:hypothetical protein